MGSVTRTPFQGIGNIIRFNWHYYALAVAFIGALLAARPFLPYPTSLVTALLVGLTGLSVVVSLAVSYYIYDLSPLYSLNWLNSLPIESGKTLVNIHAGFDETSALLSQKYPKASLQVFDFYDKSKHTEVSIERARKAYPAFPGTQTIETKALPLQANSTDYVLLIMAAHEIRDPRERLLFFAQVREAIRADGRVIVVEHLRDRNNFIAYNFGFFHFYQALTWRQAFDSAGLYLEEEIKITPFVSVFILGKHGTAS